MEEFKKDFDALREETKKQERLNHKIKWLYFVIGVGIGVLIGTLTVLSQIFLIEAV